MLLPIEANFNVFQYHFTMLDHTVFKEQYSSNSQTVVITKFGQLTNVKELASYRLMLEALVKSIHCNSLTLIMCLEVCSV